MGETHFCLIVDKGPFISYGITSSLMLFKLEDYCKTITDPNTISLTEDSEGLFTSSEQFKNFVSESFELSSIKLLNTKTNTHINLDQILEKEQEILIFPCLDHSTLHKGLLAFLTTKTSNKN